MGYAQMFGHCGQCGRLFSFNPVKVPSLRINGVTVPFCRSCIEAANPIRKAKGLPPIVPAPDAYDYCDENELE